MLILFLLFLIIPSLSYATCTVIPPEVICVDTSGNILFDEGDIKFGRPDATKGIPDFRWDDGNHKLRVRSLIVGDIGDPGDVAIQRAGPDGGNYNDVPTTVGAGYNIGTIYWRPYGSNGDWDAISGMGKIGQIYARTAEIPTGTRRGGSLFLSTTPLGQVNPLDRLGIGPDGGLSIFQSISNNPLNVGDGGTIFIYNNTLKYKAPNGIIKNILLQ